MVNSEAVQLHFCWKFAQTGKRRTENIISATVFPAFLKNYAVRSPELTLLWRWHHFDNTELADLCRIYFYNYIYACSGFFWKNESKNRFFPRNPCRQFNFRYFFSSLLCLKDTFTVKLGNNCIRINKRSLWSSFLQVASLSYTCQL